MDDYVIGPKRNEPEAPAQMKILADELRAAGVEFRQTPRGRLAAPLRLEDAEGYKQRLAALIIERVISHSCNL